MSKMNVPTCKLHGATACVYCARFALVAQLDRKPSPEALKRAPILQRPEYQTVRDLDRGLTDFDRKRSTK
jgi:hypothetical protein